MEVQSTATQTVLNHYSTIARERGVQDEPYAKKVAQSFGYNLEDLAAIPDGANMGLSCGNPLAIAGLKTVYLTSVMSCFTACLYL
jgi:arsenite methyltransferase